MPQNLMVSGAYYFEVWVRSGEEVAGFVDSAWAGLEEHQWLSSSTGSNPGHIGIAVRFLAEELAEVRFSWDGTWKNPQQIQFSQYLIPVVFALESSWRIPADAWLFLAPSIFYQPLTQREFPRLCAFPLDFEMMAQPPVCRNGLHPLESPEECADAGFHVGVLDSTALEGDFEGWPAACFVCEECDTGDLFWNNASGSGLVNATIRLAPGAAALCTRKIKVTEAPSSTSQSLPPFRLEAGACGAGYLPIFNTSVCEDAGLHLSLAFQSVIVVTLPTATDAEAFFWPSGCFYCPLCSTGHLFLNRHGMASSGGNRSEKSKTSGEASTATWLLCEMEEQEGAASLSSTSFSWDWTLPITTTAPNQIFTEPSEDTTFPQSTSLPVSNAGIIYLGDVQCENPYQVAVVLQWWEDPSTLSLIAGGMVSCCVATVCLWFWGICHRCCICIGRICCCCHAAKNRKSKDSKG